MHDAEHWIRTLELKRHPEGGWYREAYRSEESIPQESLPERFDGDRSFSTAIYYLLSGNNFSALHRLKQDEVWHFYDGCPLTIHAIHPDGRYEELCLGRNPDECERPMAVMPAGCLFGAEPSDKNSYSLCGCTVAPGFDFADFVMPERAVLLDQYPQHRTLIQRLTQNP